MNDDLIPTSLNDAIHHIMNRFKFQKVQSVMQYLGWSWRGNHSSPTIDELKSTAFDLMEGCVAAFEEAGRPREGMVFATGGFVATILWHRTPHLDLIFYVDHAESDGSH